MKILVLTNLYPPHHAGTYDFRCQSVTDALKLRGHKIRVLTSMHGMNNEQRGGEVERRLWLNGVYGHEEVSAWGELRKLELYNNAALRETLAEFKPDLIHVYSLHGLSKSFIFTLRRSLLPTVYDIADGWLSEELRHDEWLRWWNAPHAAFDVKAFRSFLELSGQRNGFDDTAPTRMMKGYDRVPQVFGGPEELKQVKPDSISAFRFDRAYFISQALKEGASQAGFRVSQAEVIYPGLRGQEYVGEVKPASVPLSKFLIAAYLDSKSGTLTAVKALQAVGQKGSKATLSIYGQGQSDYIAQVRSYIAMNHLPVEFLSVSNLVRDLPGIYRKHDALLHTAEWNEPFSVTPLEAMACGLPVIATEIGGIQEALRHGENALTCPAGDVAALTARMQELEAQPELRCRLADAGQQEALSKFNETAVIDRIENYLQTSLEVWAHTAG